MSRKSAIEKFIDEKSKSPNTILFFRFGDLIRNSVAVSVGN